MSKLKTTVSEVDGLEKRVRAVEEGIASGFDAQSKNFPALSQESGQVHKQLLALKPTIDKYVENAKEPDPEKRMYNAKTTEQVFALSERYNALLTSAQTVVDQIQAAAAPLQRAQEEAEERKKREEQARLEQARRDEEARKQQQQREEQEKEENEKRKVEEERAKAREIERVQAEAERKAFEEDQVKNKERNNRLKAATGSRVTFEQAWKLLQDNCSSQQLKITAGALFQIVRSMCLDPEQSQFKQIRVKNDVFQRDIGAHIGGEECLIALGYSLQLNTEQPAVGYQWIMDEPPLDDMDNWSRWYNTLSKAQEILGKVVG